MKRNNNSMSKLQENKIKKIKNNESIYAKKKHTKNKQYFSSNSTHPSYMILRNNTNDNQTKTQN